MRIFVPITLLVCASTLPASWQAGAAAVSLTPDESIWMAGYAARDRPSQSVRQAIHAKALALRDTAAGTTSVLVTLDLVGIRRNMAEEIAARITARHAIPRERILFNASHTHSAPLTGEAATSYRYRMGAQPGPYLAAIDRYTQALPAKIETAIDQAIAALAPATLHFEQGLAGFAVNRRRVGHRDFPGPVDHDVPVLAIRTPAGALRAVVFGYACHSTVMSDYAISGDYPGYAQAALEKRHPGAVALFVQGAGADQNPLPRRKVEHLERYGATLADAVDEVLAGKMRPVEAPLHAALEFTPLPFAAPPSREQYEGRLASKDELERLHARRMLDTLARDGRIVDTVLCPIQAWRFGDAFTLLALAGELVVDYSLRFKKQYGWERTWVAGYSNDVFGYIPSARVLREGGYEGGEAFRFSAFPGAFAADVEDRVAAGVERVMSLARR